MGILLCLLALACANSNKKTEASGPKTETGYVAEFVSASAKKFIVEIDKSMGASIHGLKVLTQGFTVRNEEHDFGNVDPVEDIFLEDLDNNGFDELYIVTRSAGSGSYATIYGLASNNDKSATPIYVRPVSEYNTSSPGLFEGYMGHNSFEMKNGKLLNTFPVYKEGDTNARPSGGKRSIEYRLLAGEAGWILEAQRLID